MLICLLGILYDVCGILGRCLVEDLTELLFVLFVHSLDCGAVFGLRIYDRFVDYVLTGSAESLVGLDGLQFYGASYVSGHHLGYFLPLLAGYGEDL